MQIWLTILASWPAPLAPMQGEGAAKRPSPGRPAAKAAASPPHITVSCPFCAPAWPPETGASTNCKPCVLGGGVQFARHLGRGRGVVNKDAPGLHARERRHQPPAPRGAGRRRCRRSKKTISAPCGCFARRAGMVRTACCAQILAHHASCFGGRAVVHRDRRARPAPSAPPWANPLRPGLKRPLCGWRGIVGGVAAGHGWFVVQKKRAMRGSGWAWVGACACRDGVQTTGEMLGARGQSVDLARWLLSLICRRRSFTESALRSASS